MHIKPGQLSNIPDIVRLGRQLFEVHARFDQDYYRLENNFDELFSDWIKNYLTQESQFIMVAENGEKSVVGFIAGFIKPLYSWFRIKSVGHISFMVIDEKFKKMGVGRLLEEQAKFWFKQKGINYIELYVEENNNVGQEAWTSYGFLSFKKFLRKKI